MLDFSSDYKRKAELYVAAKALDQEPILLRWKLARVFRIPLIPFEFWNPYLYELFGSIWFAIIYVVFLSLLAYFTEIQTEPSSIGKALLYGLLATLVQFAVRCIFLFFGFRNYPQKHSLGRWSDYA